MDKVLPSVARNVASSDCISVNTACDTLSAAPAVFVGVSTEPWWALPILSGVLNRTQACRLLPVAVALYAGRVT